MPINNDRRSPILIIGYDGATWDLADDWARSGHLPALKGLMTRGGHGPLRSVMPVMSPAAWASFATGVLPGKHGIFDFVQRAEHSYDLRSATARDFRSPAFWTIASEAGRRVAIVNVPLTYPATPVNGVMVTGLGTPDRRPFTYPAEMGDKLLAQGYRVNKTMFFEPGREQVYLRDTYDANDRLAAAALDVYKSEAWDVFVVVFRDIDEVSHYFWKHMDASHPAHDAIKDAPFANALLQFYQHIDGKLAQFVDAAGPDTDLILLSDHGFGPLYKDVFLNEWLKQEGFLATTAPASSLLQKTMTRTGLTRQRVSRVLQRSGFARLERWIHFTLGGFLKLFPSHNRATFPAAVDWSRTRCYSYGYHGQIFINLRGREPMGIVEPGAEYDETLSKLEEKLGALLDPDDGKPVVSRMVRGTELFGDTVWQGAPDLVLMMRDLAYITRLGYEFGGASGVVFQTPANHETGSHREMGIGLFAGPSFVQGGWQEPYSITDIAPTVLHLLRVGHSNPMDGRILWERLRSREGVAPSSSVSPTASSPVETWEPGSALTSEEEQELADRLRKLGYLG